MVKIVTVAGRHFLELVYRLQSMNRVPVEIHKHVNSVVRKRENINMNINVRSGHGSKSLTFTEVSGRNTKKYQSGFDIFLGTSIIFKGSGPREPDFFQWNNKGSNLVLLVLREFYGFADPWSREVWPEGQSYFECWYWATITYSRSCLLKIAGE
jgi:hypothetical protein